MTNIWNPQCGKIHWNSLYLVYCALCHLLQLFLVISSRRNGNRFHSAWRSSHFSRLCHVLHWTKLFKFNLVWLHQDFPSSGFNKCRLILGGKKQFYRAWHYIHVEEYSHPLHFAYTHSPPLFCQEKSAKLCKMCILVDLRAVVSTTDCWSIL